MLNRARQTAVVNKKKRGSSSEPESAPSGKAKGKGPAASEPHLGDHRSRSPCASGSVERTPSPTPVGDTSYRSPSPTMSPRPLSPRLPHEGEPSALSLTVVTAAVPGSADSWADTESMLGGGIDADVPAQWHSLRQRPCLSRERAQNQAGRSLWRLPRHLHRRLLRHRRGRASGAGLRVQCSRQSDRGSRA